MDKEKVKEALKAVVYVNNAIVLDDDFKSVSVAKSYNNTLSKAIRQIKEELGIVDDLGELK